MLKYGFLVVEGPHDIEFVYRLLSPFGLQRVRMEAVLDSFLRPLIPREYPPGGDLQRRMSTPLFLQSPTHSVAIHSAVGDSRLVGTVQENLSILDRASLSGIGILFDADSEKTTSAADRYEAIKREAASHGMAFPDDPGAVSPGPPRMGAFVLPDNQVSGTLEDLLLECALSAYPNLLASATAHVDNADTDGTLNADDLKDFEKPAGRNKALVGAIASILRPGKAVQVSIQDNRWLRGQTLALGRVKIVQEFLVNVLDLS